MQRSCEREHHAVGDLVGSDRIDALVDSGGRVLVATESDDGELRLDEARVNRRDPDRAAEQILPERVEKPRTANLDAMYDAPFGYACRPAIEPMKTM